ncbi:MAG: (Fe-S)-binding protein [Bacteroidales bacterium]|jgi:L-lactate dehydrogenase complex protein LldE|nr:(Fe-S)-binding protein [Bacteroidales bacterium]
MTVDLFVPCYIDQFHPETAFNAIKILEKCGIEVNYNPEQTCCGKEVYDAGFFDKAKILSEKFLDDFNNKNIIVGLSPACVSHIQTNYQNIFHNSGSHYDYLEIRNNIFELTDFLVNKIRMIDFGANFEANAYYHDSCHALRKYSHCLKEEPRILLNNIIGLNLIEVEDYECCGFGGLFSVKYNSISSAMTAQKVQKAMQLGVSHIISADCSCLMNLNAYIKKHNLPISTIHIADVIANSL